MTNAKNSFFDLNQFKNRLKSVFLLYLSTPSNLEGILVTYKLDANAAQKG